MEKQLPALFSTFPNGKGHASPPPYSSCVPVASSKLASGHSCQLSVNSTLQTKVQFHWQSRGRPTNKSATLVLNSQRLACLSLSWVLELRACAVALGSSFKSWWHFDQCTDISYLMPFWYNLGKFCQIQCHKDFFYIKISILLLWSMIRFELIFVRFFSLYTYKSNSVLSFLRLLVLWVNIVPSPHQTSSSASWWCYDLFWCLLMF